MNRYALVLLWFCLCLNLFSETVLTLDQAVSLGMNNSKELTSQEILLILEKQSRDLSIRTWFPDLSFSYSSNDSVTVNGADSYNKNLSLKVSQLVYDGGASSHSYKMMSKQLEIEKEKLKKARYQLRSRIWSEYYNLALLKSQSEIKKESLHNAQNDLSILELKAEQGGITKLDLLEATISVKKLELDIENIQNQYDDSLYQFKVLLNIPISSEIEIEKASFDSYRGFQLPWNGDEFKSICLSSSTEVKSAQLEIEKSRIQLKMSRLNFIPNIRLNGSADISGDEFPLSIPTWNLAVEISFNNPAFPSSGNFSVGKTGEHTLSRGSGASLSPFKDITTPVAKKKAEMALDTALYKYQKLTESIPFEAERAYINYEQSKKALGLESELLDLEGKKLEILQKQFQLGELEYSKLLTARTGHSQSQIAFMGKILELLELEKQLAFLLGLAPDQLQELRGEM